jgi:hypothetical protein
MSTYNIWVAEADITPNYPIVIADTLRHHSPHWLDPAMSLILREYGTPFADRVWAALRDTKYKKPYFEELERAHNDWGMELNKKEWWVLE